MKAVHIFSLLLLIVCLLIPFEPVSRYVAESSTPIYQTAPCIRWGDWKVGQSEGSGNAVITTFITNSEKTACVKVDVKYCASQPSENVHPIDRFDFEITMNNGFTVKKQVETTRGPDASKFSAETTFSVEAMLEGPADTTGGRSCNRLNGRSNTAMQVTIMFTGYYGSGETYRTAMLRKSWTQDKIDMLRQEYVDMTPPDGRAEMPVPARDKFRQQNSSSAGWNTGHYNYMIDDGLTSKKDAWRTQVNNYRKANTDSEGNTLSVFTDRQFKVSSGYRNPYHQRFHVNAPNYGSFHSRHCYGDALDIYTLDVDGDGTMEQVVGNKAQSDDGVEMENRAVDAGAKWTASWEYYSSHTHADWTSRKSWPPPPRMVYSPPCEMPAETPSLPPAGSVTPSPSPTPTPSPSYHACRVHETSVSGSHSYGTYTCGSHSGYACQESNDHKTYISSCSETENSRTCNNSSGYYECSPHSHTYPSYHACGVHLRSATGNHSLRSFCWSRDSNGYGCTVTNFYACDGHSHTYPNSADVTCAAGHTYSSTHRNVSYLNNYHRTRTCRHSACRQTWQACVNGWTAPPCNDPSRKRNGERCQAE